IRHRSVYCTGGQRSTAKPPVPLDMARGFVARAAQVTTPQTGELATESGRVAYAIMPVQIEGQSQTAQLVIVEFLAGKYENAWATIWTMTGIAVIALIAAGFFGWLVAGRVLAPIRELSETASGIGEDDLTRRIEVKGNDDVAHL